MDRADELAWLAAEQSALRRIATLVAEGAEEADVAGAVTEEIARLFDSQRANAIAAAGKHASRAHSATVSAAETGAPSPPNRFMATNTQKIVATK